MLTAMRESKKKKNKEVIVIDDEDDDEVTLDKKKRSKLAANEKPNNNRVSQQRKSYKPIVFKSEFSRDVKIIESIQRDNRVAERRKRKLADLEGSKAVPLVSNQEKSQRDKKAESKVETLWDVSDQEKSKRDKKAKSKVETLWDVPLVTKRESIQQDNVVAQQRKRKIELEAARVSRDVPLVSNQEKIQRDNNKAVKKSKVETLLWDVPLVRTQEVIKRDNDKDGEQLVEVMVETLISDPMVRIEEDIQRDNKVVEQRKKKVAETKDAETTRVVQSNKGVVAETRKKKEVESVAVVDRDYMSYLTWLVGALKDYISEPMENLQNDLSADIDPPSPDSTLRESKIVFEKALLVKVKSEVDLESWSDDIVVSDSPFLDVECSPFVVSKTVIDVEKGRTEDESSSCWFKKELMDVLKKPYDEQELLMLSGRASVTRPVTRCRELRKGRESSYETDLMGKSYLEKFSEFDDVYKLVEGDDEARLELLRGFFFYLENVCQDGAFKPWEKSSIIRCMM
ncbi:unnamed protein product [Cochlearia groenlandica]